MKKLISLTAAAAVAMCAVPFASCEKEGDIPDFSVLTWNVYLGNGDGNSVLSLIEDKMPDIIQMQEANPLAYSKFINPLLAAYPQYDVLDTQIEKETLRTPIIYNTQKFTLVASGAEVLSDSYVPNKTKTLAWVYLQSEKGNLLSVNFHGVKCLEKYDAYKDCTPDERDAIEEEWHIGNAVQLLANVDDALLRHGDCNVVITGDCNFNSSSEAYKTIVDSGYLDAEISAPVSTRDGKRTSHALGVEFSGDGLTIDHVFSDARLLTHEIIRSSDAYAGSDHCPVYVTAKFGGR